jgi:hypothetical protein
VARAASLALRQRRWRFARFEVLLRFSQLMTARDSSSDPPLSATTKGFYAGLSSRPDFLGSSSLSQGGSTAQKDSVFWFELLPPPHRRTREAAAPDWVMQKKGSPSSSTGRPSLSRRSLPLSIQIARLDRTPRSLSVPASRRHNIR